MGLEQAIQNLADAINGYTKAYGSGVSGLLMSSEPLKAAVYAEADDSGRAEREAGEKQDAELAEREKADAAKAKAAAEKKLAKAKVEAEAMKAAAAEAAKEPEVIPAGEKTEQEIRDEAFNIETGYCTRPFLDLGKNGGRDQQAAILKDFGVARLSLVATDDIPALRTAIVNAVAVASTKKSA